MTSIHTCYLWSSHHTPLWRTWLHSLENLHIGAGKVPQAFSSPGSTTGTAPLLLTKQKLITPANLGSCLLNSLQFINISLVPGKGAQLDAVFWTWSNKGHMEWDHYLTWPTGCAPWAELTGHHDPQSFLSWAAPRTGCAGAGVTPDRERARKPPPSLRSCLNGKFA